MSQSSQTGKAGPAGPDRNRSASGRRRRIRLATLLAVAVVLCAWLGSEMIRAYRQRAVVRTIWSLGGYVRRELEKRQADTRVPAWYRAVLGDDFMHRVVVVRLAGTEAADEDLVQIGRLTHLRMLDLRDTRVTDAGLKHLSGLRDLRLLILTGTEVSDAGLAPLRNMPRLEVLCLEETPVTDAGLRHLAKLPNLGWLNLSESRITDAGLIRLGSCRRLEVLIVDGCRVTEEGKRALQEASPRVRIYDEKTRAPSAAFSYW